MDLTAAVCSLPPELWGEAWILLAESGARTEADVSRILGDLRLANIEQEDFAHDSL